MHFPIAEVSPADSGISKHVHLSLKFSRYRQFCYRASLISISSSTNIISLRSLGSLIDKLNLTPF